MAVDPIFLGPPVSEPGVEGIIFNELAVPLWYNGESIVERNLEVGTVPAIFRAIPEESGRATAAATLSMQVRIIFEGVWDVVFIDAFDDVSIPTPDCALVLKLYKDDGETVAWEVGTSPWHPYPFLCLPENYGAQELDIVAGAATIGQVEVTVIDKAQEPGDQDSGWLTERLTDGAVPAIRDRRCQLIRYINDILPPVVIADGPASVPRMDDTYAAYKWVVKDVRETERKIRAFTRTDSTWLLPMGIENGWGLWDDEGTPTWLIDPKTPLTGTYRVQFGGEVGYAVLDDYWQDAFSAIWFPTTDVVLSREVELAVGLLDLFVSQGELQGQPGKTYYDWPDLEVLWKPEGSSDPWIVIQPTTVSPILRDEPIARSLVIWANEQVNGGAVLTDGTPITAAIKFQIRGVTLASTHDPDTGQLVWVPVEGDYPTDGQRIDVALRYKGAPTKTVPLYLEFDDDGVTRLTAGRLLQKLYDGEYSDRDPITGLVVSTGIRYDEDDLLLMTDPVRARITEPIEDLRDWAEKYVYAPTGWAPSLDNNLAISPSSQAIPDSFDGLPIFDDDKVEPVPTWNAGETLVNLLDFSYERWVDRDLYVNEQATTIDDLEPRDVTYRYRSVGSLTRREEKETFDGRMFAAVGTFAGLSVEEETGALLAAARKLYVFDRYNTGAQTIEIPVKRSVSAELKPGDWIVIDLSWLPDYALRRKGTAWGGQIVAIHDIDCAWRIILIEEAVPLIIS